MPRSMRNQLLIKAIYILFRKKHVCVQGAPSIYRAREGMKSVAMPDRPRVYRRKVRKGIETLPTTYRDHEQKPTQHKMNITLFILCGGL